MAKRFDGAVVIITGAAGGFGSSAAHAFAGEGASLVLADLDSEKLEALKREIDGPAATLAGNIAEPDAMKALLDLAMSEFGRVDVAINNAGIVHDLAGLPDVPVDVAQRVFDVDLIGVYHAMRHQLPVLEAGHREDAKPRAIVNVASVAGVVGAAGLSVYAAAKHGVVGLTRSAAVEYARRGIRINAVCPSFARTAMATDILDSGKMSETEMARGIPMRRLAERDEVVTAMLFLADPANGFMTGQTVHVDGGLTAY